MGIYLFMFQTGIQRKEILGAESSHFVWPTHHLIYFTPNTLKYFLESMGFEILHWETQGLDLTDILWYLNEKTKMIMNLLNKTLRFYNFILMLVGMGKIFECMQD